jgi:hypothetical protein
MSTKFARSIDYRDLNAGVRAKEPHKRAVLKEARRFNRLLIDAGLMGLIAGSRRGPSGFICRKVLKILWKPQ